VIQPADFRLFKFKATPFDGIRIRHRFHDFNDFCSTCDAFLLELDKAILRRRAGFVCLLKNTVASAT
jgi:hypothetical protein